MNGFTILGVNADSFIHDQHGQRVWKCDACGGANVWGPSWSWWGNYVRRGSQGWYDNGTMEWVACSPACAEKLKANVGAAPPGAVERTKEKP